MQCKAISQRTHRRLRNISQSNTTARMPSAVVDEESGLMLVEVVDVVGHHDLGTRVPNASPEKAEQEDE